MTTRALRPSAFPAARALAACALALTACSKPPPPAPPAPPPPPDRVLAPAPRPATPDAPFRREAPPAGPEVVFSPPKVDEMRLSNGVRVLLVERHELPVVAIDVTTDRGADQGAPGVGGFVGALMLSGTKTRNAIEISDALASIGAQYGGSAGYDALALHLQVVSAEFERALAITADVVRNASFPDVEVERARSRRLTALAQENDSPGALLSNEVARVLYPNGHPYQQSLLASEAAIKKATPADLRHFYASVVRPSTVTVAVAGDVTKADLVDKLEKVFAGWKGGPVAARAPQAPPPATAGAPKVIVVDRPGATQSYLAVTLVGVPRSTKDYEALVVMNTLFGGSFSSRLNMNLREAHAYTYGARSLFDMRHGPGPFSAGGAIVREATAPAIKETLSELDRLRGDLVTDAELADAKSYLIRQLPARFETVGETSQTLAGLAAYHLPVDEYTHRAERIERVTKEDIKRVAAAYLGADRLRVVVVGDAAVIGPGLGSLGLGKVDVRTASAHEQPAPGVGPVHLSDSLRSQTRTTRSG